MQTSFVFYGIESVFLPPFFRGSRGAAAVRRPYDGRRKLVWRPWHAHDGGRRTTGMIT
ncbi:MAG: hypothetical protein ACFN4H_05755 [Prevotella sp.]